MQYGPHEYTLLSVLDVNGDGRDDLLTRGPNLGVTYDQYVTINSEWKVLVSGSTLGFTEQVLSGWLVPGWTLTAPQLSHMVCATQESIVDLRGRRIR